MWFPDSRAFLGPRRQAAGAPGCGGAAEPARRWGLQSPLPTCSKRAMKHKEYSGGLTQTPHSHGPWELHPEREIGRRGGNPAQGQVPEGGTSCRSPFSQPPHAGSEPPCPRAPYPRVGQMAGRGPGAGNATNGPGEGAGSAAPEGPGRRRRLQGTVRRLPQRGRGSVFRGMRTVSKAPVSRGADRGGQQCCSAIGVPVSLRTRGEAAVLLPAGGQPRGLCGPRGRPGGDAGAPGGAPGRPRTLAPPPLRSVRCSFRRRLHRPSPA